tara:strand:+ start:920 stop:2419 length:1500 start_codon:yes stop_codon:yes gene_type:complete
MMVKIKFTFIFLIFVLEGLFGLEYEDSELALHHFMQGEFLMNQGNYSLAILEFQDAIELDPNASTIHVSIADAYLKLGKIKRSKSHLEIAIDLNPKEHEALEILGEIYIKSKDYKNAQIVFKKLHDLNPSELDYIFALADLARIEKDWDLAIDYYIEGYNTDNIAVNGLEQALQISIAINNFNKAEKVCELLLVEQPDNIKIVQTLIDLSLFNNNYDLSLKMLSKLENIKGVSAEIAIQKSVIYQELQNQEEALNVLLELVKIDSQNIDILDRIVNLLIEQKNNAQALLFNKQIIQNYAEDPRGYINNAIIALGNKNPEGAVSSLKPYIEKFTNNFSYQYLIGTAYYQLKDYDNSKIYLKNALQIYPQSKNTKHSLALIYDTMGEWDKSDKLYMELISNDSTDAQAYNNYAYSLVEREENIEFALELAKNAIRLEPKSAAYLDTLGWIYYKLSNYDEALFYISESIGLDSNNVTIKDHFDEILKVKAEKNIKESQQVGN